MANFVFLAVLMLSKYCQLVYVVMEIYYCPQNSRLEVNLCIDGMFKYW